MMNKWSSGQCPIKSKDTKLKKAYGISLDQYEEWKTLTGNICHICKKEERIIDKRTGEIRNLAVDHDKLTGLVRGLLCSTCNRAIGMLKHNPLNALEAALYLEYFDKVTKPGVENASKIR